MNSAHFLCSTIGILSFAIGTPNLQADFTAAADIQTGAQGVIGIETIGYKFTVGASPITIDALGLNSGTGDLGFTTVPVHVWLDGTVIDLATAGINNSDSLSSIQAGGSLQYYYESIAPVTLLANTTYVIGADLQTSGQGGRFTGIVVSDPRITVGPTISGTNSHPTGNSDSLPQHFGPSFQIAAVPEPTSVILAGAGLFAVSLLRRNRGGSGS